jgi:hypothetical protein
VKTTYNRYAKVVPGSHVAAAKKLDKYLGQEPISGTDRTKHRTTEAPEREKPAQGASFGSTATGIRTPVSAVRGRRPSPLDDGGQRRASVAMGLQNSLPFCPGCGGTLGT